MTTSTQGNFLSNPICGRGVGAGVLARRLATRRSCHTVAHLGAPWTIFIVDPDISSRTKARDLLEKNGYRVETYADALAFIVSYRPSRRGCLLVEATMPGINGIELIRRLQDAGDKTPAIMISDHAEARTILQAMKAGAVEFIDKPIRSEELLASIKRAQAQGGTATSPAAFRRSAADRVARLTARQSEILELVVAGHPSKNIAADLCLSQRTVDSHRAAIMRKTGSHSLPELIRTVMCAHCSLNTRNDRQVRLPEHHYDMIANSFPA